MVLRGRYGGTQKGPGALGKVLVRSEPVAERAATAKPIADPIRARRLRADAKRPMSVNLAEGIALSHKLSQFVGAARRRATSAVGVVEPGRRGAERVDRGRAGSEVRGRVRDRDDRLVVGRDGDR